MNPNLLVFSTPTVGDSTLTASPAATYAFISKGYQPPLQGRASEQDLVINQNGKFQYNYDNGPLPFRWQPFELHFADKFAPILGGRTATQQWNDFQALWNHLGSKNMQGPEDIYSIIFPSQEIERRFIAGFPLSVGDKIEFVITVQVVEG